MYKITRLEKGLLLGKHAFVTQEKSVLEPICEVYGRNPNNMCLKPFYASPLSSNQTIKDALWGDNPPRPDEPRKNTTVWAGTQVQNILWKYKLSPRVYALFDVLLKADENNKEERVACQLTDFIKGKHAQKIEECYEMQNKIDNLGKDFGFASQTRKFGSKDIVNGLCVDPQLWAFDNKSYEEVVKEIYFKHGKYGKIYYQNDDRLGVHGGPRHSEDRIKYMQLDKIDFKGKVVWDIGCAGGFFCRYAIDRGAKRVIGFDMKEPLIAAFHAGNYLGYFNIDYIEADLNKGIPEAPKADIAFYLSLNLHVGIPQKIFEADTVIFEDNGRESRNLDKLGEPWTKYYKNIKFLGRAKDHGMKALYLLRR